MTRRKFLSLLGVLPIAGPPLLAVATRAEVERLNPKPTNSVNNPELLHCRWQHIGGGMQFVLMENCHYNPEGMLVTTDPSKPTRFKTRFFKI